MNFKAVDHRTEGTSLLRQCQLAELYIFDVFCEICDKFKLTYFIYGGTLLGAARHNGFIPWDDDIDVAMPKADYIKFLELAPAVLPETLLLTPSAEYGGRDAFAKIIDRCSFVMEERTNVEYPCGIYIDIFPYEKIAKLPLTLSNVLARKCYIPWLFAEMHRFLSHKTVASLFSSACKAFVFMSISNFYRYIHYILRCFMHNVWRCSPEVPLYRPHVGFEDDTLFPLTKLMFEGRSCSAPAKYDLFLTQYYGEWKNLPPAEERHWHARMISTTRPPIAKWALKQNTANESCIELK